MWISQVLFPVSAEVGDFVETRKCNLLKKIQLKNYTPIFQPCLSKNTNMDILTSPGRKHGRDAYNALWNLKKRLLPLPTIYFKKY